MEIERTDIEALYSMISATLRLSLKQAAAPKPEHTPLQLAAFDIVDFLGDVLPRQAFRWRRPTHRGSPDCEWVGCPWVIGAPGILVTVVPDGRLLYRLSDSDGRPVGPYVSRVDAVAEAAAVITELEADQAAAFHRRRIAAIPPLEWKPEQPVDEVHPGMSMDF